MRPVFARPFINAARRHLYKMGVAPDMIVYCRLLPPGGLDPVLDLARLPYSNAFACVLTVEVVTCELLT